MIGVMILFASTLAIIASAVPTGGEIHAQEQLWQDSSLECEATMTTAVGQELFENREDMELEAIGQPSEAPSEAPSLSLPCSDPFSNARGSYTSSKAPCVIAFHNEDESEQPNPLGANRKRYHDGDKRSSSQYYHGTSNVCGTENKIGEAKEYISAWPDECVGDFARCYDLKVPSHLMCQALNTVLEGLRDLRRLEFASGISGGSESNILSWTTRGLLDALVPPGTTHVSLDCTIDKEAVIERYEQIAEIEHKKVREKISIDKEWTLFVIVSVLGAVLIVVFAISHLVVKPIVGAVREGFGSGRQAEGDQIGNNQLVSLVSYNSGLRVETDVEENDQEGEADQILREDLPLDEDETTHDMTPHPQQIPMDFDAVPIVPATIVPIEAVYAEVIQDGITYYP
jgi:hypothetical protein